VIFECGIILKEEKKVGFDKNLKELDEILARLEEGKLPLNEALSAFELGVALVKESRAFLDKAEQKVTLLTKDGEVVPYPSSEPRPRSRKRYEGGEG
jgi:exodeoxyribonuclease VII small subunit